MVTCYIFFEELRESVAFVLNRVTVAIVGSGLSREPALLDAALSVCIDLMDRQVPIVLDGVTVFSFTLEDGLGLVRHDCIKSYSKLIVTPNFREYDRLCSNLVASKTCFSWAIDTQSESIPIEKLAQMFRNIVIVRKGEIDTIAKNDALLECRSEGGKKRVAGQGDLLAGIIGAFLSRVADDNVSVLLGAICSACCVVRCASRLGFESERCSLLTSDILRHLNPAISKVLAISANRRADDE